MDYQGVVMYRNRRCHSFVGVQHFNIIADPATHSKKEVYVSVVWSWEQDLAAMGDVQLMLPGNYITPS